MRARGFTLIELLVAISIFALIGMASYRVLSSVMQTNERLSVRVEQLRLLNRAFWVLQQDVEQMVPRDVRTATGAVSTAHNFLLVDNEAELPLQFTRAGRANPLGLPRSDLQRIAYAVGHHPDYEKTDSPHYHEEKSYLLRYTWPMVDGAGDRERAQVQVLLPDVEKIGIGVMTARGVQSQWPVDGLNDPPLALQFEFTAVGGVINRAYKLL
jgi:general secretion pathway protein J